MLRSRAAAHRDGARLLAARARARRRHAALRVRLPRRPERRLAVRLACRPGPGRASLHGRGGAHRRPARSRVRLRRRATRSRASARMRPGVAFIPRRLAFLEPTICRSLYRDRVRAEARRPRRRGVRDHRARPRGGPPARGAQRGRDGVLGTPGGRRARRAARTRRRHGPRPDATSSATAISRTKASHGSTTASRGCATAARRAAAGRPELPLGRATLLRLLDPLPHERDAHPAVWSPSGAAASAFASTTRFSRSLSRPPRTTKSAA